MTTKTTTTPNTTRRASKASERPPTAMINDLQAVQGALNRLNTPDHTPAPAGAGAYPFSTQGD